MCAIRAENKKLREQLGLSHTTIDTAPQNTLSKSASPPTHNLSTDEKIILFRSYFRGREDVYALRWEGKDGKKAIHQHVPTIGIALRVLMIGANVPDVKNDVF